MRVGCIIQARLNNNGRLPRKVLADIGGWPMIRHVWHRANQILPGMPVVIAMPHGEMRELPPNLQDLHVDADCDENDVLQRYLIVAKQHGFEGVMRITGDCPLIDPAACLEVLDLFLKGKYDYVANDLRPSYPKGMGCEVFTREALERAHQNVKSTNPKDREHVTPWIIRGVNGSYFDGRNVRCPIVGVENLNVSVDTQEDLERVRHVDARLPGGHLKYALETTLMAYGQVVQNPAYLASDNIQ